MDAPTHCAHIQHKMKLSVFKDELPRMSQQGSLQLAYKKKHVLDSENQGKNQIIQGKSNKVSSCEQAWMKPKKGFKERRKHIDGTQQFLTPSKDMT